MSYQWPFLSDVKYSVCFSVALDFETVGAFDPLIFNRMFANAGEGYSSGYFRVPANGVYFFHTSVAAKDTEGVTFALSGTPFFTNILRTSRSHNGADTMSKDFMSSLAVGTTLKIVSSNPAGIYSDGELQTSWSGFSLTAAMRSVVAFCATRSSPWSTPGRVPYDDVILNEGNGFQSSSNVFRAPFPGIYYLSFSTGSMAFEGQRVQMISNLQGQIVELWRESTTHNGYDALSRATMVNLQLGEEVSISIEQGSITSSGESRAISFCGFLYLPKDNPVAWSVHRTTSWISTGSR